MKRMGVVLGITAALVVTASPAVAKPMSAQSPPAKHRKAKPARTDARLQTKVDERYGQLYRVGNSGLWMN